MSAWGDFVITVPSATRVGGKFFLNEDLLDAAQSEFFSVANRMEMQVAPENLEATLKVIMKDEGIQIAAFDFKDMARDYLGQMLPTMEMIEENQFEQQADFVPYVEPTKETAAQLDMLLQSGVELSETPQAERPQSPPDQAEAQPTEDNTKQIAPPANQTGKAEKSVAQFLHEGGLAQEVLKGDDFHFEIKNGPYEPLVVERITNQLSLTHYREQYGELQLDSEMVFGIDGRGKLNLEEVAVQNPLTGGEIRELDREFGATFAQNIVNQGFADAALEQLPDLLKEREAEQLQSEPVMIEELTEAKSEAPTQTEQTPTKATEETTQEVESPSTTETRPEPTVTSNQETEPTAIEEPEVTPPETPSQSTAHAKQPQQETPTQQTEAPKPKPKLQAKPEDWPKYASALGRGHVIQARIKKVIAAYQQGTALDMKASISMGKDFREFTQELNSIRDWYRAAQQLNRGDEHLAKIMKVGNNFKLGKPLSNRARTIRTQDINQATYNRFSTELNRDNPHKFLVRLAANAAKAGLSNRRIMGALSMDPEVQSMHYQNGEQASLKYSRSIMLEGLKLKKREQPKVIASQQSQEISRNQGLGR